MRRGKPLRIPELRCCEIFMDDIKERIKEYAILLDATIEEGDLVDFVVDEVVDRALVYTNRYQFVTYYEEQLAELEGEEALDEYVIVPIPLALERILGRTVVNVFKQSSAGNKISSLSDNGQSVTYADVNEFLSKDDEDVFKGCTAMLNKFRVPTVVENTR